MLGRVAPLDFEASIYTNLTPEHLDFHKTMEEYAAAKEILCTKSKIGIFCADNEYVKKAAEKGLCKSYTYSIVKDADFVATNVKLDSIKSVSYTLTDNNGKQTDIFCDIGGAFSVYNTLGAVVCALLLGIPEEKIVNALKDIPGVPGRIERVTPQEAPFTAVVDYAHTPDAITNVLNAIHEVQGGKGKVITVVGAGGNRDKGKRPLMAQEAVKGSDKVIITSDNPRFEEPQDIIADMLAGLTPAQKANVVTITDRREAIRTACMLAAKGDVILVAGKGHETYQDIKGVKQHFDDKEVLREAFGE
jgi:UDP-N-acetylmuramoyl-L-alanyl-D-glutamate--2,6-diaminopimelate ligase